MFIDLLVDPLADRLKRFIRRKGSSGQHHSQPTQDVDHAAETGLQEQSRKLHSSGFFHEAKDFTINNPTMIERVEVVNNMISGGRTVLEHLMSYTEPGAAMDSSARDPPPKCHPGTRLKIGGKLETWLDDPKRECNMMWLHGPAGTGKSAIAQTFAEHCYEKGRLGAAFFFSRPNKRNKPETVIPTLVYQLAFHSRGFNAILSQQLASDPQWMTKALHVQLRRLIIEPFSALQAQERGCIREPFVVILDGLDECEGERAQFKFVSMVNEAAQSKHLPLLWLICSRPEAHLQYTFSRVPYCGREELLLDDECRDDVNRYLCDELARIKDEYADITPPSWPSEDQFNELSSSISGLFVFASTGVKYIEDPTYANPVNQLEKFLSFLKHAGAIGTDLLATLDLLYTQILISVPGETLPITQRILAYLIYIPRVGQSWEPVQVLCNFLHIDKVAFYSALRKLHSVVAVPAPENASETPLRFHHASFQDFLLDPNRSGRFVIEEQKALIDLAKSSLFWHGIDTAYFHTNDGWDFDRKHQHASLPNLKWVEADNEKDVSRGVANLAISCNVVFNHLSGERDEDFFSCVHDLDFRYVYRLYFPQLASWFYRQDPLDNIVRTKPSNELDMRLLEHLKTVIGQGRANPIAFPLAFPWEYRYYSADRRRSYFFIGRGEKTTIVCITACRDEQDLHTLNLDKAPTPQQIKQYQDWLVEIKWNETPDCEEGEEPAAEPQRENGVVSLQ